jgi:hypothetical protein
MAPRARNKSFFQKTLEAARGAFWRGFGGERRRGGRPNSRVRRMAGRGGLGWLVDGVMGRIGAWRSEVRRGDGGRV